ncbi:MAG: hypothetical protein JO205_03270 [Pseudolabrys sp.]|nr:hypothetical protein [Pseudolabrys sp.]MBV9260370.1 hypothetical protein [Pseudolabrys sp.]
MTKRYLIEPQIKNETVGKRFSQVPPKWTQKLWPNSDLHLLRSVNAHNEFNGAERATCLNELS